MEDTRDAIVWLRENADSLNIQPDKIIGKGISAGGHLVSAISILQPKPNSIPNALVLISPALDTSDEYFKSLLSNGSNPSTLSPLKGLASGLEMPPTLILQGKTDNLTPTRFAKEFNSKMDSLGYSCQLIIYENVGHLFTPSHLDDTGWPQSDPDIMRKAIGEEDNFLRTIGYLK